jgi:ABC-2 type transport system ATP-binding protein
MIRTVGLQKHYGDTVAVAGVDLDVPTGSIYGLVGPNGAGKTTLLGMLAGLRHPTAGIIELEVARRRVAVLPDTPHFDPWLTAWEVLDLARTLVDPGIPRERSDELLHDTGLEEAADRTIGGFSRGMLQRLGVASTLVGNPELVLLDEPCAALDPLGRREVLDLIARLRRSATIVFSSHILADVQEVCDTVAILRQGSLLFQGPLEDLLVGKAVPRYLVRLRSDATQVAAALRHHPWVTGIEERGDLLRVGVESLARAEEELPGALAAAGAVVVSMGPEAASLEDVFLEVMA